jgi:hypothetical protein
MVRFASPRIAASVLFCSLGFAPSICAQEASPRPVSEAADEAQLQLAAPPQSILRAEPRRPGALMPLYVSFGALQALDAHSTSRALSNGASEANPVMRPFAGNTAGMLAIKAAGTAGVIYASEKMWKKNRTAAIVFMVATNAAMAWVVQHNYRATR